MRSRFRHLFKNKALLLALLFWVLSVTGGIVFPQAIIAFLNRTNARVLQVFGTYYLVFGFVVVGLSALLMLLPLSRKRLGSGKAEYSRFSWIALLYSTGMGSGLLLRAVQEPIYYYRYPPVSHIGPEQLALQYTFFHWGFTPWAMYSLFGLMVAWQLYIKKKGNIAQAVLPGSQNKTGVRITHLFIILITLVGVVASLGLGAGQFIGGLKVIFGWSIGDKGLLLTVFGVGLMATVSALTGIQKMIRYLADFDLALSICLMLFVALFLSGSASLDTTLQAFGTYLVHFAEMSLSIGDYRASKAFTEDWTVFYWAFWLAWVPFTGIFIARISKGRTIREFLFATIIVPAMATMLWFSVFANKAIALMQQGGSYAGEYEDLFTSLYHFLYQLPLGSITVTITAVLVLIAILNSVDSAIFVLAMFSDHGNINPAPVHKLAWGIIITATSLGISALGSDALLNAISKLLIIMALPFSILYGWQILRFLYQTINERKK
ncbi:MAG: BCCT family transporter [Chitinophagaceae bacterium]|nr:BCCT family transporter [Chitinophagaceae bacterium]